MAKNNSTIGMIKNVVNSGLFPENVIKITILLFAFSIAFLNVRAQSSAVKLGAYYFDGWKKEKGNAHLTPELKQNLARKPVWGWVTSTQAIMDKQIDAAANAGLSFFSFCWYYNPAKNMDSSNRILLYYHNSPKKARLKYCLMVANHAGFEIGPKEWPVVTKEWVKQFQSGTYLLVNGKPLIIFFSVNTLVKKFGSVAGVKSALGSFRSSAKGSGLNGVVIAACVSEGTNKEISTAEACGFDMLTGYNNHTSGLKAANVFTQNVPISKLQAVETNLWNKLAANTKLPYIPAVTLGWDPRPWATAKNKYATNPYFSGVSESSVYASVKNGIKWVNNNPKHTTAEKIALLYAWNEYGEGAWLTPSANGENNLNGVKKAVSGK